MILALAEKGLTLLAQDLLFVHTACTRPTYWICCELTHVLFTVRKALDSIYDLDSVYSITF